MSTSRLVPKKSPIIDLFEKHDTDHGVFVSHLDNTPISAKLLAFSIPCSMNLAFAAILVWRLFAGTPYTLLALTLSLVYGEVLPTKNIPAWYWCALQSAIDYFLFLDGWPVVQKFITGHLWLRLRWGFRQSEIVFRKPKASWSFRVDTSPEERQKEFQDNVYRAIDLKLVNENTGYLTSVGVWILNYKLITEAYALAAQGVVDESIWQLAVWQKVQGEWTVWEVWRAHDKDHMGRVMIVFQEKLAALGKLDIIAQWQANRAAGVGADGSDRPITTAVNEEILALFKNEGLDMETLWCESEAEAQKRAQL